MRLRVQKCVGQRKRRAQTGHRTVIKKVKNQLTKIHEEMLDHISQKKFITNMQAQNHLKEIATISNVKEYMKYPDVRQVTEKLTRQMKTITESHRDNVFCDYKNIHNEEAQELRSSQSTPSNLDAGENIDDLNTYRSHLDRDLSSNQILRSINYSTNNAYNNEFDAPLNLDDDHQKVLSANMALHVRQEIHKYPKCAEAVNHLKSDVNGGSSILKPAMVGNNTDNIGNVNDKKFTSIEDKIISTPNLSSKYVKDTNVEIYQNKQDVDKDSESIVTGLKEMHLRTEISNYKRNSSKPILENPTETSQIFTSQIPNNSEFCDFFSTKKHAERVNVTSNVVLNHTNIVLEEGTIHSMNRLVLRKTKSKSLESQRSTTCQSSSIIPGVTVMKKSKTPSKLKHFKNIKTELKTTLTKNDEFTNCRDSRESQHMISVNTIPVSENPAPALNYNTKCLQRKDKITKTNRVKDRALRTTNSKAKPVTKLCGAKMPAHKTVKEESKCTKETHIDLSWIENIQFVRCIEPDEYFVGELNDTVCSDEGMLLDCSNTPFSKVVPFSDF